MYRNNRGWKIHCIFINIVFLFVRYKILSQYGALYWTGDEGSNVRYGEFRTNQTGDKFWIRYEGDDLYSIGVLYNTGVAVCPLFWSSSSTLIKIAEFRCGRSVNDTFWFKSK